MQQKKAKSPDFEPQVTQSLVQAKLSSPPGMMDFFLEPKVFNPLMKQFR